MATHPTLDELMDGKAQAHAKGCEHCTLLLSVMNEVALGHGSMLRSPETRENCLSVETLAAVAHLEQCLDCMEILHDSLAVAAELEEEAVPGVLEAARQSPPQDASAWRALLARFHVEEGSNAVQKVWTGLVDLGAELRNSRFGLLPLVRWWGAEPAMLTAAPAGTAKAPPSYRVERLPLLVDVSPEECAVEVSWDLGGRVILHTDPLPVGMHVTIRGVISLQPDGGEALGKECVFQLVGTGQRDYDVQPWRELLERFPPDSVPELSVSWSFTAMNVTPAGDPA
jgi:hypothetical protein